MRIGKWHRLSDEDKKKLLDLSSINSVDPEIRNIVLDLRENGYMTIESCAGHWGSPGFIEFPGDLGDAELEDIQSILSEHGLHNIRLIYLTSPGWYQFMFDPIGGDRY